VHGTREELKAKLVNWLQAQRPQASALSVSDFTAPAAGASNETLLFTVSWQQDGARHTQPLVARLQPSGPGVFPEYELDQQYRAMALLADTDVPVPGLSGFEADPSVLGTPFYLMQRIDGKVITENPPYYMEGWFHDLPAQQRAAIWRNGIRAAACVNRQDWRALGFGYLDRPALGATPLQQQFAYYRRFLTYAEERGRPYPKLRAVQAWLEAHQPRDEPVALCWGDAKAANLLLDGTEVVGVLDWEMVHLGNPVDDLAWWMTLDDSMSEGLQIMVGMDIPKLPGVPGRDELVALWESESGHSAEHLDYYLLFGAYKFGIIMASIGSKYTREGLVPAEMEMDIRNTCTAVLDRHMAAHGVLE
jgi:aminoglycoside phosphotransferase (APT) family kinase protein